MKKVLLLGGGGLMGRYLLSGLSSSKHEVRSFRRSELDITDTEKSCRILQEEDTDVVINAAAFCRMEECEGHPEISEAVNAVAPVRWAQLCHERGIPFVQLSTDYVFGGGRTTPFSEEDLPHPLSLYARHKRDAETGVLKYPEHLVLRLAWIFGVGGSTFMSRIPGLLEKDDSLKVATGRVGGCLYAGYGAELISFFLERLVQGTGGLYHLTHQGAVTWQTFADECKRQMLEKGMRVRNQEIVPVATGEHEALRARRPDYSVLDLGKTESFLGQKPVTWQEGLSRYLDEMSGCRAV